MSQNDLDKQLERAQRAVERVERALAAGRQDSARDDALRTRVREVVAELDEMIASAGGR